MKTISAWVIRIIIAIVILFHNFSCLADTEMANPPVKVGDIFSNFKVKTTDGSVFDLYKELEDKELAMISIWYMGCPYSAELSYSIQSDYEQYKYEVAFIGINPIDDVKRIQQYNEARGFLFPNAIYKGGKKWTDNSYPYVLIIHKDGTVLYSWLGTGLTPVELSKLLDACLSMTEEQKTKIEEENIVVPRKGTDLDSQFSSFMDLIEASFSDTQDEITIEEKYNNLLEKEALPLSKEEELRQRVLQESYRSVYNLKNNMTIHVEESGIQRIVVDNYADLLERVEAVGEFFIVPDKNMLHVSIDTGKGFSAKKASLYMQDQDDNVRQTVRFQEVDREKNKYSFELELNPECRYIFYEDPSEYSAELNCVGFVPFASEEEAKKYFDACKKKYGFEFQWHVEHSDANTTD